MVKTPFTKPYRTVTEQIEILILRGMIVDDREHAIRVLSNVGYYRLRAYWIPFEADHTSHIFTPGTRFSVVAAIYEFDRQLRVLFGECLERIEVSLRAAFVDCLASNFGAHGHLTADHSRNRMELQVVASRLKRELRRSREPFVGHFTRKYTEPTPPIWACCEVMSLGTLSKWYGNVIRPSLAKQIAKRYGVQNTVLTSWLHHLNIVRNIVAHHGRLWNREFAIMPRIPLRLDYPSPFSANSRRIFNTIMILNHLRNHIEPGNTWLRDVEQLMQRFHINREAMGFPHRTEA